MAAQNVVYDTPFRRAQGYIRILRLELRSGITSNRDPAVAPPTAVDLARTLIVSANGRRQVTAQAASVEWLPDASKMLIPMGLLDAADDPLSNAEDLAFKTYNTFRHIAQVQGIDAADRYGDVVNNGPARDLELNQFDQADANAPLPITMTYRVGYYDENAQFVLDPDRTQAREAWIVFTWGTNADKELFLALNVSANTDAPANAAAMLEDSSVLDQLSDQISAACVLNYSIRDRSSLLSDRMRFADTQCQEVHGYPFYEVQLAPYTLSMTAALNMASLNSYTSLAWARAYCLSMGLLPHHASLHNTEYLVTDELPEGAELRAVLDAHPEGEEGQRFPRMALSLAAAFGGLHLANDHTWRDNDANLKRKAKTFVLACRTTMTQAELDTLIADNALPYAIRTTMHPFGLASTYSAFRDGQHHRFIAEPLQIRNTLCPPPVVNVGMCLSELNKIYALPIGALFRAAYGDVYDRLTVVQTQIMTNVAQYSSLYRHYGYDRQRVITREEEQMVDGLLPILAAYSEVFNQGPNGEPLGAAYSYAITKCQATMGAIVAIYANAFRRYVDGAQDIRQLITGAVTDAPRAIMGGAGGGGGAMMLGR